MKLNKQIKTHIADMAIRKKYKAEFDNLMKAMSDKAYHGLYAKYNNGDFKVLPERSLKLVQNSKHVNIDTIRMEKREPYGRSIGYGLNVSFQTRSEIGTIELEKPILGASRTIYDADTLFADEYKAVIKLLKEASTARQTLLDAMAHYKSSKKMFSELLWSEDFYPEQEKKPVCNIVPISTIAAANELMGVQS